MRGVAALAGPEEAAVRALEAGVDAICLGHDLPLEPVHAAVEAAVSSGRLSAGRLAESVLRLERLGRGLPIPNGIPRTSVGAEAARRAVQTEGDVRVSGIPLVLELVATPNVAAGPRGRWLAELVSERWPGAEIVRVGPQEPPPRTASDRPLVVVLQNAARHEWQQPIADVPDAVVIETGIPAWRPERPAGFVAAGGAGRANLEAAFGVRLCALVEAVDLHLQAVVAEVEQQVALELTRGLVGDPAAAEVGVDGKAAEVRDSAAPVCHLEAHRTGALAVDLDHEPPEILELGERALDLGSNAVGVAHANGRQERLDFLMREQLDQEIEVRELGASNLDAQGACAAAGWRRREGLSIPEPSATPSRTSASPATAAIVSGSSRKTTPSTSAIPGSRYVTRAAFVEPCVPSST